MSMIEKMSIIGIRSFGPDDSNQQVITFQHPLTLLVGPNGAGKTTIIECLRYATTGEQPLNTKGGAFIHDPKLAHASEVRAKVRLKCKTIRGHEITVERGMIAIQKQKTVQFKTTDGFIQKEVNGEKQHLSSKCAEINREMVSALGVSKAVLDNVIFVHQEESNWPLSEGKSVKQRFDDIFAATRYIKALDEIKKVQKNQRAQKGEEDVALTFLEQNCIRASDIRRDLESTTTKLQVAQQSKDNVAAELEPIEKQIREFSKKRMQISELVGELNSLQSRKKQMIEDHDKLESRITNIFNGTNEQLTQLQKEQEETLNLKQRKKTQCEGRVRPMERNIEEERKKKTSFSVEQGKLQQDVKNANLRRKNRCRLIRALCEECAIQLPEFDGDDIDDDELEKFETVFEKYGANQARQLKNEKAELDNHRKEAESVFQKAWQEKTEVVEGCKHKKKTLIDLKEKQAKNLRELKRIQSAADGDQLEMLQKQEGSTERELGEVEKKNNIEALKCDLESMNSQKSTLQSQEESLESEIFEAQKFAQTRTRIEMLEEEVAKKDDQARRLKSKNREPLSQIGFSLTPFPDKTQLSQWIEDKEKNLLRSQKKHDVTRTNLNKLKFQLESTMSEMDEKKKRRGELDETLFEVCGSQDLEQDLTVLETDIKKLRGKKGLTDGIQHMYRKFIADMKPEDVTDKKEVPCPLCQRLFDEATEVDELIAVLEEKLSVAPKKLENQTKELAKKEARLKLLQDNKPVKIEFDRLSQTDIPELQSRVAKLSSEITQVDEETDALDVDSAQLLKEVNLAKSCLGDVTQIDTLSNEISNLKSDIRNQKKLLPVVASTKSVEDLNKEKQTLSLKLKKVFKSIEQVRKEIESKTEQIYRLKEKLNSIREEKIKLANDLQKREQLQDAQKVLDADIKQVKSEIERLESELAPRERKVKELTKKKDDAIKRCEVKANEVLKQKQDFESKRNEIESFNREIQRFDESGKSEKLERTTKSIVQTESRIKTLTLNLEQLRDEIAKIQNDIATCTDRQRDLKDNVALRERSREIEKAGKEIAEKRNELGGMDSDKINRESLRLDQERDRLSKERVRVAEREIHLKEEMKKCKAQLNTDDYKHADEKYNDSLVNSTTLGLSIDDLGKYYKALDRAVMQFHKMKMNEINKMIKDLWEETYQGKDIDYIEICSSEDTGSASSRRVFNYRVVMHAHGVSMDMRGRCSAGQKVLASLVIRLALAEAFCINCGILALDEPTTNLDRDNIESLAKALVSIIDSRSQQRNFQLVVITHDEDFVDLLARSNYVDHFFRITKDERARSRIHRCPVHDLEP